MKKAIVCGGSRGLGRSIAPALARDGWGVAICARSREGVERVAPSTAEGRAVQENSRARVIEMLRRPDRIARRAPRPELT